MGGGGSGEPDRPGGRKIRSLSVSRKTAEGGPALMPAARWMRRGDRRT